MKKNEGITLIALIITIIILIILTAITINNVIGSDLIGFATKAAENYIDAEKEEDEEIAKLLGKLDNAGVGDDSKVRAGKIVEKTEKDNYTDAEGRTATIPAGFKVSTKSSEQYIKDGLVIQDGDGNEFVWVPCYYGEKIEGIPDDVQEYKSHAYAGSVTGIDDTYSAQDTGEGNWKTYSYTKYKNNWKDTAATDYGNTSIQKYGGFYIGRYEAGWEETVTSNFTGDSVPYITDYNTEVSKKNITTKKPVSKANVFSWNFISQENAKEVSEKMYEGVTYNENSKYSNSVDSKLVDGTAWDTITNWIAKDGVDVTVSTSYGNYWDTNKVYNGWYAEHARGTRKTDNTGIVPGWLYAKKFTNGPTNLQGVRLNDNNGKLWNEKKDNYTDSEKVDIENNYIYTRIEIPTGSYNDFKLKNIYDLAGNMWEWTTEVDYHTRNEDKETETVNDKAQYAVFRGGSFYSNSGTTDPICCRYGRRSATTAPEEAGIGFRVALYIK